MATASESTDAITGLYRRVWAHADKTIADLPIDAAGEVRWWPPERRAVTLHQILVHVVAETHRHAGHADIIREFVDGNIGLREKAPNVPSGGQEWWSEYRQQVEDAARAASEQR